MNTKNKIIMYSRYSYICKLVTKLKKSMNINCENIINSDGEISQFELLYDRYNELIMWLSKCSDFIVTFVKYKEGPDGTIIMEKNTSKNLDSLK